VVYTEPLWTTILVNAARLRHRDIHIIMMNDDLDRAIMPRRRRDHIFIIISRNADAAAHSYHHER
jgi:hypothetical protein